MVRFVDQLFPFFHHLLFPRFALSSYPLQSNDKYTMNPNFSMDWLKKEINVEPITERRSLEIKKSYRCERIIVVQRSSTDSKSFFWEEPIWRNPSMLQNESEVKWSFEMCTSTKGLDRTLWGSQARFTMKQTLWNKTSLYNSALNSDWSPVVVGYFHPKLSRNGNNNCH